MVDEARTIGGAGGLFSKIDSLRAGFERQIMTRHRHIRQVEGFPKLSKRLALLPRDSIFGEILPISHVLCLEKGFL